jgi:hypothetical protein
MENDIWLEVWEEGGEEYFKCGILLSFCLVGGRRRVAISYTMHQHFKLDLGIYLHSTK